MLNDRAVNTIACLTGLAYIGLYLYGLGDLGPGRGSWQWDAVPVTLDRILTLRSGFRFEAIARAELGSVVVLLSPGNLLVGGLLGLLLALNIHGVFRLRRGECRVSPAWGAAAGAVPALFAGGACCAPGLLLLIGLPGLGAFAGLFSWLVPLGLLLLLGARLWQRHQGARAVAGFL